jgi:small subunit ribosomal protein S3Ae
LSKAKATRKIRDKWRAKEWYDVYAPTYFGEKKVASIPCSDPAKVVGRVIETTLYDITNDFSHQSQKLYFLAANVKGNRADTILKGHEYSADYLRSLVRRGSTRIDAIFNVTSKDQYVTRASVVAFTRDRVNANQQHMIRSMMRKTVEEKAATLSYDQLCHEMVLGIFGSEVYNLAKKVSPLRHVGVRKSKLLVIPEGVMAKPEEISVQLKAAAA